MDGHPGGMSITYQSVPPAAMVTFAARFRKTGKLGRSFGSARALPARRVNEEAESNRIKPVWPVFGNQRRVWDRRAGRSLASLSRRDCGIAISGGAGMERGVRHAAGHAATAGFKMSKNL
jgi:hypothetical protein